MQCWTSYLGRAAGVEGNDGMKPNGPGAMCGQRRKTHLRHSNQVRIHARALLCGATEKRRRREWSGNAAVPTPPMGRNSAHGSTDVSALALLSWPREEFLLPPRSKARPPAASEPAVQSFSATAPLVARTLRRTLRRSSNRAHSSVQRQRSCAVAFPNFPTPGAA